MYTTLYKNIIHAWDPAEGKWTSDILCCCV